MQSKTQETQPRAEGGYRFKVNHCFYEYVLGQQQQQKSQKADDDCRFKVNHCFTNNIAWDTGKYSQNAEGDCRCNVTICFH